MKRAWSFFALLLSLAWSGNSQESVTGTWKVEEVAFAPWTFVLKAEGPKLTGSVGMGGFSEGAAIYGGAVNGNAVTFKVDSPGGERTITFSGVLADGILTFTREVKVPPGGDPGMNGIYGASGAARFTAKRVSASTSDLRVVFLGTGTPIPDPARSGPSVAVVAGSQAYLVDAGPGVVRRAREAAEHTQIAALLPTSLTFLFLTHLHSDHTLGYPDLIFTPAVVGRRRPLEVFGPKGTEEMTGHLLAAWKKDMEVRINGLEHERADTYQVNVHEIKPGVVYQDGNVTVTAFLVKHATWDQAFGYRFEAGGHSVVISGDTAPISSVADACRGCDILIHEVYCNQGRGDYYRAAHTSANELAVIAAQAKPKLLVLYHQLYTGCSDAMLLEQVRQKYAGAVVSAKDLDMY